MIIFTTLFIFAALFCIVLGIHTITVTDRRTMIRQRLLQLDSMADALDPSILREERLSSIGMLNKLLIQLHLARHLETLLVQAGLQTKVSVFCLMSLSFLAMTGLLVNMLAHHLILAIFSGVCAGLLPLAIVILKKERRVKLFNEQFPEALDLMVGALRAGFALSGAIQMVADESPAPVGTELRILFEEQKLGLDIREALLNLSRRMDSTDAALFVTAVLIQRDTGGNLAEVLEKIADVIRDRFRILGEIRTFTAVGRLSGLILGLLPPLMGLIITALNPEYMRILLDHPFGTHVISAAVIMQVMGFLVIRKIVNIKI